MALIGSKTKYYLQLSALVISGLIMLMGSVPGLNWTFSTSLLGNITLGTILGFVFLWMAYDKYKLR